MTIDATVTFVQLQENGSGMLHLCDRVPNGSRGQDRLSFDTAPHEVTALTGLDIWGGDSQILLGRRQIALRIGRGRISFIARESFLSAVAAYHAATTRGPSRTEGGVRRMGVHAQMAADCWRLMWALMSEDLQARVEAEALETAALNLIEIACGRAAESQRLALGGGPPTDVEQ